MRCLLLLLLLVLGLAAPALAQDPLTSKALERIAQYEKLEPDLKAGDAKTANHYLNQLAWAGKRLNAVSDKTEATWKRAQARYQALWQKIEAKAKGDGPAPAPQGGYDYEKLVQLNKEIGNAFNNLKILSVKHLADESRVKGIRKEIAGFETRLEAFPAADNNVKLVTANLADFKKVFEAGLSQLREGQAGSADIAKRLAELRQKYESQNRPQNLSHPFNEQQVRAWALEMRRWRERELPMDLAFLAKARSNPAVEQNPILSMQNWLTGSWMRNLDEVEKLTRERVTSDVDQGQATAAFILETDPDNRNHVLQRVLGKGAFDENMTWLRDGLHAVAMARVYDEAMGSPAVMGPTLSDPAAPRPAQPDRDAQQALVEKAIAHLTRLAKLTLDQVRMPRPASTDPELVRIAEATLRNPDYEIAGWQRLVINVDKSSKLRREAWLKPGTSYLTLSYYEYAWDEFQVTTAEKRGNEIWLFANRLKRYSSGDPTTPVGRWILSRRFELTPILAEHVGD